jgi:threonine dehydrogenase-like Zn-dependent dehydrogenase
LLVQAVKRAGAARIVAVDLAQWRLDMAAALGATETILADANAGKQLMQLEPYGYDVVTDATGVPSVIQDMLAYAKPRAKVWIFGVAPVGAKAAFVPYDVFRKDLKIVGSFAVNRTFPQSIALIENGAVQVEPLISHRLPLEEFCAGLDLAQHDPKRMKVQFEIT